jgi:hypothetical protein
MGRYQAGSFCGAALASTARGVEGGSEDRKRLASHQSDGKRLQEKQRARLAKENRNVESKILNISIRTGLFVSCCSTTEATIKKLRNQCKPKRSGNV